MLVIVLVVFVVLVIVEQLTVECFVMCLMETDTARFMWEEAKHTFLESSQYGAVWAHCLKLMAKGSSWLKSKLLVRCVECTTLILFS